MIEKNHKWQLIVTRTDNGWLLENPYLDNCDGFDTYSIEESEDCENTYDLHAVVRMLQAILEFFGIYYSKHNKENIEIEVVKNKEK